MRVAVKRLWGADQRSNGLRSPPPVRQSPRARIAPLPPARAPDAGWHTGRLRDANICSTPRARRGQSFSSAGRPRSFRTTSAQIASCAQADAVPCFAYWRLSVWPDDRSRLRCSAAAQQIFTAQRGRACQTRPCDRSSIPYAFIASITRTQRTKNHVRHCYQPVRMSSDGSPRPSELLWLLAVDRSGLLSATPDPHDHQTAAAQYSTSPVRLIAFISPRTRPVVAQIRPLRAAVACTPSWRTPAFIHSAGSSFTSSSTTPASTKFLMVARPRHHRKRA